MELAFMDIVYKMSSALSFGYSVYMIAMSWASGWNSLVYGWDSMPLYLQKGERSGMQWSKHPTNKFGVAAVYEAGHCGQVKAMS